MPPQNSGKVAGLIKSLAQETDSKDAWPIGEQIINLANSDTHKSMQFKDSLTELLNNRQTSELTKEVATWVLEEI